MKLDYVLQLSTRKILDRRLQTSISTRFGKVHPPCACSNQQRHIVRQTDENSASLCSCDLKAIDFAMTSPFGAEGRPGRKKRKKMKSGGGDDE